MAWWKSSMASTRSAGSGPANLPATASCGTLITTFGRDLTVASTLFDRPVFPGKIGRQTRP